MTSSTKVCAAHVCCDIMNKIYTLTELVSIFDPSCHFDGDCNLKKDIITWQCYDNKCSSNTAKTVEKFSCAQNVMCEKSKRRTKFFDPLNSPPLITIKRNAKKIVTRRTQQVPDRLDSDIKNAILTSVSLLSDDESDDDIPDFSYREMNISNSYGKSH